jgi:hypothetical protein
VSRFAFALQSGGIKVGNAPIPLGTVTPGVTLTAGDSLTIRLYFSCGSSSAGRYGTLKNVMAKGVVLNTSPVKLISFSGGYDNNIATLWWSTANELNAKNFFVESSNDGVHFTEIGKLAAENSLNGSHYQYVDSRLLTGNVYYRLRITDISGSISYSNILKISTSSKIFRIGICPNPADKEITITYPHVQNNASISINSMDGKKVMLQHLQQGTVTTSLDISGLVKGMYFVTYCSEGEVITKKLIKK